MIPNHNILLKEVQSIELKMLDFVFSQGGGPLSQWPVSSKGAKCPSLHSMQFIAATYVTNYFSCTLAVRSQKTINKSFFKESFARSLLKMSLSILS